MTVIDDLLALVDRLTGHDPQPDAAREYPTDAERREAWIREHGEGDE